MHWLGLIVVISIAGVAAFYLLQRLFDAQQRLTSLHDELRRNDLRLEDELSRLKAQSTQQNQEPGNIQEEENFER